MKRTLLVMCLLALPLAGVGQPSAVLEFHQSMGGGDLILRFCGEPKRSWLKPWAAPVAVCYDRRAIIFGQVCDSGAARDIGNGNSGDVEGGVPSDMKYAGFYCRAGGRLHTPDEMISGGGNWMN